MVSDELISYIKVEKKKGFTYHQIEKILLQNGYTQDEIDQAIQVVEGVVNNVSSNNTKLKELRKHDSTKNELQTSNNDDKNNEEESQTEELHTSKNKRKTKYPIRERKIWHVVVLGLVLFWVYPIYWLIDTTRELKHNVGGPSPWLLLINIIPIIGLLVFNYKYSLSLSKLTGANKILIFLLLSFIPIVGMAFAQLELNKLSTF